MPTPPSPRPSRLRAHDDPGDPPDGAWVNDDEDAAAGDSSEAGGVSLIDGDLARYRDDEANPT